MILQVSEQNDLGWFEQIDMGQPVILLLGESDGVGYCAFAKLVNGRLICELDSGSELVDGLRLSPNRLEIGVTGDDGDPVFVDGVVEQLDSCGDKVTVIIRLSAPSKFGALSEGAPFLT